MPQGDTVIANLQSALGCASQCDCCAKVDGLQAQIDQLKNGFIPKSDRPQIIQQSVASAEQLIMPGVLVAIAKAIELLRPEIKAIEVIAKGAAAIAGKLAALLPVIGALLALAGAAGTLLVLGERIDGLENQVDTLSHDLSQAIGAIGRIRRLAETGISLAEQAKSDVNDLRRLIMALEAKILSAVDGKINALKSEIVGLVDAKVQSLKRETEAAIAALAFNLNNRINEVRAALMLEINGLAERMARAELRIDAIIERVNNLQELIRTLLREFILDATNSLRFLIEEANGRIAKVAEVAKIALDTARLALSKTKNPVDETEISSIKSRIGVIEAAIPRIRDTAQKAIDTATAISAKIGALEASIPGTVGTIVNVIAPPIAQTAVQTFTPPLVQSLVPPLITSLVPPLVGNLVPPLIDGIKNQITNIINNITNITNIVNQPVNIDLSGIERRIDAIPGSMIAAFVASPAVFEKTKAASKAGTCEASSPGGCIDTSIGRNNNNLFDKIANLFNTGANAAQLALLKIIDTKLGKQISDSVGAAIGISGGLLRIGQSTVLDRLLNLMTFAATIHNATQLSSNIGITLIQAMQNVIDLIGLRDANEQAYNISQLIGTSINSFVAAIIGEENLAGIKKEWAKYNRIYQAGANMFSSLLSMGDTMVNAIQIVSGQNAKIGNALKVWGVVGEKAFGWMNITPNFSNPLLTKLQSLEETASTVEQISQEPLNVKSAKEGLEAASKELADSLEEKEGSQQGKELPEAKKVKETADKDKKDAEGTPKTLSDAFPDDDED